MGNDVENQMEEFMKPLFGDMALKTLEDQKGKLGLGGELKYEDYVKVSESIRDLCRKMAGNNIADRIYNGLIEIINEHYGE